MPCVIAASILAVFTPQDGSQDADYAARVPATTELLAESCTVPLRMVGGHPVVSVLLQGEGPFPMLLDTGAMGTAVFADLAEELGLEVVGQTTLGDPSNPAANEADLVTVEELAIGDTWFYDFQAVAWQRPAAVPGDARGIVGLPLFTGCLMTLDYAKSELILTQGELPAPDGREVIATSRDPYGVILFPIQVAGVPMQAHLDSGNSSSLVLPAEFEEQLPIVEGSRRTGRGMRASGPVEFTIAQLDGDLEIGALKLARPEIRFDAKLTAPNLGFSMIQGRRMTLDQKNGRLRLQGPEAAAGSGE